MNAAAPIMPAGPSLGIERLFAPQPAAATGAAPAQSFSQVLMNGIDSADRKVAAADAQVRAFALDDSVPLHQVTFALEDARLSLELMLQVRSRLVEGYQQIMNMQL
ncbi:MAG TPA: flagellar hook-basal body complex protein FliE [Allosphingosinicella sp.]|nr:flagellar hook-basal body complex protein FliE [Allosphingosinicella sp.]